MCCESGQWVEASRIPGSVGDRNVLPYVCIGTQSWQHTYLLPAQDETNATCSLAVQTHAPPNRTRHFPT